MNTGSTKLRRSLRSRSAAPAVMEEAERRILFAALTALPVLHSLPTATAKLYLDFDGDPAISDWLGSAVPATPAFDIDSDPTTFSTGELNAINEIWARVAEKYSPFKIDVTTVDPGNRTNKLTSQIIIGGDGAWLGAPAGGVAPLGGFYNSAPNVGFVFSGLGGFTNKGIAEATAHEAGHTFGLEHHSTFDQTDTKIDEYDPGTSQVAPIMGVSYYALRGVWNNGPSSPGANVIQDDVAVLSGSNNGFGYRIDDHGGTLFSGETIIPVGAAFTNSGVIERNGDVDAFIFTANSGTLNVSLDTAAFGPTLDATIKLFDAFGALVAQSDTSSLDETLVATGLAAGTYMIAVSGAGAYGDLGQYTLSGTLPGGGIPVSSDHSLVQGTDEDDNISVTLVNGEYKLDINGDVQTFDPSVILQFDILSGAGDDVVTIGPGVCKAYILGGAGNDTLTGGDFNDIITASAGNDVIFGGAGDDRLSGSAGHDIIVGGIGRDRLYGDAGNDAMSGGAGVDRLYGGEDHDVLSGESSADKLYGENGNDTVYGGKGGDLLNGGNGLDQLYAGADNDVLYGRDIGFDLVNGGAGDDKAQSEDEDVQESIEELLA